MAHVDVDFHVASNNFPMASQLKSPNLVGETLATCPNSPVPNSWLLKTEVELRAMLQQAYQTIREKERGKL